ncbi:hypothetical protein SARC_06082 [Sphaeroforma arctica JP610]|uniref:Uncharacterized protein n=1 Tax=Sphaeroforma arctica JP610 TaxID=667725 RepID=A0A0L0FYB2_9EUKA|nr:hypothetical protein SARC_06082 [Sphaeroforma arctica JP610]KNC81604.1 hypothetical protein SARC_06082 [Sphaeroforma arctica JP610]|eukprot:XP_014155506.1 hypothetical protein SARC_06082 [Sphaeroforma arctica JP610]
MSGILRDNVFYLKDRHGQYCDLGVLFETLEVQDTHIVITLPNKTNFKLMRKPDTPESHLPINTKKGRVNRMYVERQVLCVLYDCGTKGYVPSISLCGNTSTKPPCTPKHTLMPKLLKRPEYMQRRPKKYGNCTQAQPVTPTCTTKPAVVVLRGGWRDPIVLEPVAACVAAGVRRTVPSIDCRV